MAEPTYHQDRWWVQQEGQWFVWDGSRWVPYRDPAHAVGTGMRLFLSLLVGVVAGFGAAVLLYIVEVKAGEPGAGEAAARSVTPAFLVVGGLSGAWMWRRLGRSGNRAQ